MSWHDDLNAIDTDQLGRRCPACGAERRERHSHRPPVDWRGCLWYCQRCHEGGNVVGWLGWHVLGRRPTDDDWRAIRAAAESRGWLSQGATPTRPPEVRRPPPQYPPASEVAALWGACRPLSGEEARWVHSRGADVDLVRAWDLARSLPTGRLPAWAEAWRDGWRCVIPAHDWRGEVVTLRARWTRGGGQPVKTRPPTGHDLRGTALVGPGVVESAADVLVVEGEPAWLVAVTRARVPVVGVYAGCGDERLWRAIRGRVRVATDGDAQGDRYAERLAGWSRSAVRERPPEGLGWDDAWLAQRRAS